MTEMRWEKGETVTDRGTKAAFERVTRVDTSTLPSAQTARV